MNANKILENKFSLECHVQLGLGRLDAFIAYQGLHQNWNVCSYIQHTKFQDLGTHLYLQHLHKPSGRYVWQVVNYVGRIIITILEFHHVHQEVAFQLKFTMLLYT